MNGVRSKAGLMVVVALTGGALWAVDLFLARTERTELSDEGRRDFEQGSALLTAKRPADAIEPLRKARALDRDNREFALALAEALKGAGKLDEAGDLLQELLDKNPNDGETNLAEARLSVRKGDWASGSAYYHRAIFGSWNSDSAARQVAVRLELANLLAERGDQKDLLAELLPLESEAAGDEAIERQIAHLYMVAGSPPRAEALYRSLHAQNPDPELATGIGDAELAQGNYRSAEAAFQTAISEGADEAALRQRIQLATDVSALDPTLRFLSSAEKLRRSLVILRQVVDQVKDCGEAALAPKIEDADKMLKARIRGVATNELAEERLSVAEQLWQSKGTSCGGGDRALQLVMAKLQGAR